MNNDVIDTKELERLLDGVNPPRLERGRNDRIMELVDRKTGIETSKRARPALHFSRRAAIALAACLALIICLGVGTYAYAENAEYNRAVAYCEANSIPTDGLSRSEIKSLYRSIKAGVDVYGEDGEPDHTENEAEVSGIVFPAESAIPDKNEQQEGVELHEANHVRSGYAEWEETEDGVVISCYDGEGLIWTYTTDELDVWWTEFVDGGYVIVGCERHTEGAVEGSHPVLLKLDESGSHVWTCGLDEGEVWTVLGGEDGSVTAFASANDHRNGNDNKLIVTTIGSEGEIVSSAVNVLDDPVRVGETVRFNDGFASILHNDGKEHFEEQSIALIDSDGRLIKNVSLSADGEEYEYFELFNYDGKLFVSANISRRGLIDAAYTDGADMSDEEFTEIVKSAFTAALLVFDDIDGAPEALYEVEGAYGLSLVLNDEGLIEWDVHSVCSAEYDPHYVPGETLSIKAMAKIYKYTFDETGCFVEKIDTGEIMEF